MSHTSSTPRDEGNRSLQRGLAVLECVSRGRDEGVRVVQLMAFCSLERATVYRLLATLIDTGYVARRDRFWYVPGPRLDNLRVMPLDDGSARLRAVLQRISELTEDTAFAIVREGTQAHCIARHIGSYPIQVLAVQEGRRQPLGVGAAGLALLASLSPVEATEIVSANAAALIAYGGMTPERLLLLLKATRERGWSVVSNHVVSDTLGVGCAVPAPNGIPLAAVSVAAPVHRMSRGRQSAVVDVIRKTLNELLPQGF